MMAAAPADSVAGTAPVPISQAGAVVRPVPREFAASPDEELVDHTYLGSTGLRPSFLRQQIELFETDTQTKIDTLYALHTLAKDDAIRDILHSLKGNASSLGAPVLAQLCADIEQIGSTELTSGLGKSRLDQLQTLYQSTCVALRDYVADAGN